MMRAPKHAWKLAPAAVAALALAGPPQADASIIYQETFDNDTEENQNLEDAPWNWSWAINAGGGRPAGADVGLVSGGEFGYNFQNEDEMQAVISWFDDVNIAQGDITELAVDIRHGDADSETRFVVQVGGEWFATATPGMMETPHDGDEWTEISWAFSSVGAWVPILNDDDPFDGISGQDGGEGFDLLATGQLNGDDLPSGNITAVGVYNYTPDLSGWPGSAIRYDNPTVIPEPASLALIGAGGLLLLRRRR